MSKKALLVITLSLVISLVFVAVCLLLHPLWEDVSNFLSTSFPIMLSATIAGGVCFAGLLYLLETSTFGKRWHFILFVIADVVMIGLLSYLLYELGAERSVLVRQAKSSLPYVLWFGSIVLYLWFMPRSEFLKSKPAIIGFIALLSVSALIWFNLPFKIKLTSRPAVYVQENGVVVVWGTNMTATGKVIYSLDDHPTQIATNQAHGLKDLGDGVVRVFIPMQSLPASMSLTAESEGIKKVNPISVEKNGTVASEIVSIRFPAAGDAVSFVSFSDLHEQLGVYSQLASNVPWGEIDLAVYNGDLVNNILGARQVTNTILALPTGDRDLPRIFVRGNHETRNESARLLDDWLLPNGGNWYHAFTAGNTFFIVLDGGEDKPDNDKEYGGLVDFSTYHQEQAEWLEEVLASPAYRDAQYRVVLLHIPLFGKGETPPAFEPVAAQLRNNPDIDLMINGHTHDYGIFMPDETGLPYPVAFSGGPKLGTAAAVIVRMGEEELNIQVVDTKGYVVEELP